MAEKIETICLECAHAVKARIPENHVATFHTNICDICNKEKNVTEPRDFGKTRHLVENPPEGLFEVWSENIHKDGSLEEPRYHGKSKGKTFKEAVYSLAKRRKEFSLYLNEVEYPERKTSYITYKGNKVYGKRAKEYNGSRV